MIRVLAIDDQPVIRCTKIVDLCDLRVAHGMEQIQFWLKHFKPEIILLDHDMPGFNGNDVITSFWENFIGIPIIIWSHNHEAVKNMRSRLEEKAEIFDIEDEWIIAVQPFDATKSGEDYIKFLTWIVQTSQKDKE